MPAHSDGPTDTLDRRQRGAMVLGTAAVYLGAIILIIAGCEEFVAGPLGLPRFWYVNRNLWIGLGILLIPLGAALQSGKLRRDQPWRATVGGRRFHSLRLYTRSGCHLCDDALQVLTDPIYHEYLPSAEIVDIDGDPDLTARFGLTIPVVECDGEVRFKGRVDESLLRRLIEGSPPL